MYLALEEKPTEIAAHFNLLGAEENDSIIVLHDMLGQPLAAVRAAIENKRPVLVIIDTIAKFLRIPKMNDYGQVNDAVRWIHDLARDTGAHVLAVTHSKKAREDDSMDNLLGSTAFAGAVDTLIALCESKGTRSISTIQRYGESMEQTALQFDSVHRFLSLGSTTSEHRLHERAEREQEMSQSIAHFVEAHPGCKEVDITSNITGKAEKIREHLHKLLKVRLRREGTGRAGDPFLYYAEVPIEGAV